MSRGVSIERAERADFGLPPDPPDPESYRCHDCGEWCDEDELVCGRCPLCGGPCSSEHELAAEARVERAIEAAEGRWLGLDEPEDRRWWRAP